MLREKLVAQDKPNTQNIDKPGNAGKPQQTASKHRRCTGPTRPLMEAKNLMTHSKGGRCQKKCRKQITRIQHVSNTMLKLNQQRKTENKKASTLKRNFLSGKP